MTDGLFYDAESQEMRCTGCSQYVFRSGASDFVRYARNHAADCPVPESTDQPAADQPAADQQETAVAEEMTAAQSVGKAGAHQTLDIDAVLLPTERCEEEVDGDATAPPHVFVPCCSRHEAACEWIDADGVRCIGSRDEPCHVDAARREES